MTDEDARGAAMAAAEVEARAEVHRRRAEEKATFTPTDPTGFPQAGSRSRAAIDESDAAEDELEIRLAALRAGYRDGGAEHDRLMAEARDYWSREGVRSRQTW